MDLTNWVYLFTFGYDIDVYAYGCLRIGINRNTGKQVVGYVMNGGA